MKRGRPKLAFRHDPDRFIMALAMLFSLYGASRRGSVEIALAYVLGVPVGRQRPSWGRGLGMLTTVFELPDRQPGALVDHAHWLRRKLNKTLGDRAALYWLATMSHAWDVALARGGEQRILHLAAQVGEQRFAKAVLLPLVRSPMEPELRRFLRQRILIPQTR